MMKKLERAEFDERMKRGKCTPVYRTFLADRETPVAAFSRLGEDEDAFLLESVAGGETRGRYSYIGLEPYGEVQGEALEELRSTEGLQNKYEAFAPHQEWRPQTKFERKGIEAGRSISELFFVRKE